MTTSGDLKSYCPETPLPNSSIKTRKAGLPSGPSPRTHKGSKTVSPTCPTHSLKFLSQEVVRCGGKNNALEVRSFHLFQTPRLKR